MSFLLVGQSLRQATRDVSFIFDDLLTHFATRAQLSKSYLSCMYFQHFAPECFHSLGCTSC